MRVRPSDLYLLYTAKVPGVMFVGVDLTARSRGVRSKRAMPNVEVVSRESGSSRFYSHHTA